MAVGLICWQTQSAEMRSRRNRRFRFALAIVIFTPTFCYSRAVISAVGSKSCKQILLAALVCLLQRLLQSAGSCSVQHSA